jgi:hypothetical protein
MGKTPNPHFIPLTSYTIKITVKSINYIASAIKIISPKDN